MVPRALTGPAWERITNGRDGLANRMGLVYLILGCGLVFATGGFAAASFRFACATDFLLAVYVLSATTIGVVSLTLSPADAFTRGSLLAATAIALAIAVGVWLIRGRPGPPPLRPAWDTVRDAAREPVIAVLGVAVLLALGYAAALAVATPPNDYDALWYHLPRAAMWKQQHAVAYIASPNDLRMNVFPPFAEITSAWAMVLEGTERFASLVQLVALVATVGAIAGIARQIGLDHRRALLGALLFATLPVVALQTATPLNDIVVASFIVIAAFFLVRARTGALVVGGLALALAVGTKGTALLGLPVLLAVAIALCPRRRLLPALAVGLIAIAAGSFWYAVNYHEEGRLLPRFTPRDQPVAHAPAITRIVAQTARMAVDAVDPAGSVGRDRFVYLLAAAVLVAVGSVAARRARSRALLVVGVVAAAICALPLLFDPLNDLLLRGYQHVLVSRGQQDLAFLAFDKDPRLPSPFTSWYGPVGLLAVLVTIPLAIRAVRRRRLPGGALVLSLAPVAYVLLIVLGVAYTTFSGRYVMPGVALAAATWGLVAEVRPLAWGLAAVAVVTLALSMVHYEEKPAGFAVLGGSSPPSVWTKSRADVFAASKAPTASAPIRLLDERAAAGDVVALLIRQDDVSYPFFGARLDRRIVFLDRDAPRLTNRANWLVEAPGLDAAPCASGWRKVSLGEPGWGLYRRVGVCGDSASP